MLPLGSSNSFLFYAETFQFDETLFVSYVKNQIKTFDKTPYSNPNGNVITMPSDMHAIDMVYRM
jgi:hypothetical protein